MIVLLVKDDKVLHGWGTDCQEESKPMSRIIRQERSLTYRKGIMAKKERKDIATSIFPRLVRSRLCMSRVRGSSCVGDKEKDALG